MIQMSEGFKLYKNEPLDSRMQFNSMAEMKATEDFKLYDGCFATIANDPNKITSWTEIIKGETRAKNDIENINN